MASEAIRPVEGDSVPGHIRVLEDVEGDIAFYPVAGSDNWIWIAVLPHLPDAATVEIEVAVGAFQDLAGNPNTHPVMGLIRLERNPSPQPTTY